MKDPFSVYKKIEKIGSGGQGAVYRVKSINNEEVAAKLIESISKSPADFDANVRLNYAIDLQGALMEAGKNYALKVLKSPEDLIDPDNALQRMRDEIQAINLVSHRCLVNINDNHLDHDSAWYVTDYYKNGPIGKNTDLFQGDVIKTLELFLPLARGVKALHDKNLVHRDIKPDNVLVSDDKQNLVLCDFGLVYFDDSHTRLSNTIGNVGSRDWMPAWAFGMRVNNVKPNFDIFSLGKLLWSMISGKPMLRLWYFKDEESNLEGMFPDDPIMAEVNRVLERVVVERESACLSSIDDFIELLLDLQYLCGVRNVTSPVVRLKCKFCCTGSLVRFASNPNQVRQYGLQASGTSEHKLLRCNYCGHIEHFYKPNSGEQLSGWGIV